MTYVRLGLAALLVSAIRSAVADPAEQQQLDDQQQQIDAVRAKFDDLTGQLSSVQAAVAANGNLDDDQAATLDGIKSELSDLATALAGPRDDTTDNGVLAEVEQHPDADPSPAADAIVEDAPAAPEGGAEEEQQEEQQQD